MAHYSSRLHVETRAHNAVLDITADVEQVVAESGALNGQVCVFTPHATAAITINENDDPNIGVDFLRALARTVRQRDRWLGPGDHDRRFPADCPLCEPFRASKTRPVAGPGD